MEPFSNTNIPVLLTYIHIDEMVFRNMNQYKNYKFVNVESDFEEVLKDIKKLSNQEQDAKEPTSKISEED